MYLEVFADNPFGTNCWLLSGPDSDDAVVVDPGFSPDRIMSMLESAGKRPVAVLATHGHFDHIGSVGALCGDDVPLYIHEADAQALTDPSAWGSGMPVPPIPVSEVRGLVEGDVLELAGLRFEVMHTPGHTPGSVCFLLQELSLSGDLVFKGAIGRYDFPNSSPEDMVKSLQRFLTLPDSLSVYPGHGDTTTVGHERRTNPFLLEL